MRATIHAVVRVTDCLEDRYRMRPRSEDAEERTTSQDHQEKIICAHSREFGVTVRVEDASTCGYMRRWSSESSTEQGMEGDKQGQITCQQVL